MDRDAHPVDQFLPIPKLLTLGLQHVLVMYAGAVAVPLILGRALKLSPEDVAFLISEDYSPAGLLHSCKVLAFRASASACRS
jgi:NCS2 family nucleobase:cation symporter-2